MPDTVEVKESRRDQILRIATGIFCEKTYHGTTLKDIADAVVFLASDRAACVTAQTLVVDSGQTVVR